MALACVALGVFGVRCKRFFNNTITRKFKIIVSETGRVLKKPARETHKRENAQKCAQWK